MKAYERLDKYVRIDTQSDDTSNTSPSTEKQFNLLKLLKEELKNMGLDPVLTKTGYIYCLIKGNADCDPVAFIAHVDTALEMPGKDVKPQYIYNWDGSDIKLNEEYSLSIDKFPVLKNALNKTLMVTSGDTLLGADDKAGVAEIMTLAEILTSDSGIKHGDIYVCFTPDEEIGRGTAHFELDKCPAKFAYTCDGDMTGGIEYENFNAASAVVNITGVGIHPGEAKGKMINAASLATYYHQQLPKEMVPEKTEGYEGFIHLNSLEGDVEKAKLSYILRDHDWDKLTEKKEYMIKAKDLTNELAGKEVCEVEIKDSYKNMAVLLKDNMYVVDIAKNAIEKAGVEVNCKPIRGGTDGANLTYMGLPCPNLGTGCANFHGRYEFAILEDMDKAVEILLNIVEGTVNR